MTKSKGNSGIQTSVDAGGSHKQVTRALKPGEAEEMLVALGQMSIGGAAKEPDKEALRHAESSEMREPGADLR